MKNVIITSGKRKKAVARAVLRPGTGKILINNTFLDTWANNDVLKMFVSEPLYLAGATWGKIDFDIKVNGGGFNGQAEAVRLAIARALTKFDNKLQKVFLEYDRNLLVADVRYKEPKKPNTHSNARAKVAKSYR